MKMPPTVEIENKPSKLLSFDENNQVFRLMGNRCQALTTAVVQLFLTDPPNHSHWFKQHTGVLCFVKDNIRKNYFFRLFCLRRNTMLWEHEMYNDLEYIESTSFFHVFEGQDYLVAFNFADQDEAREIKKTVDYRNYLKKKKEERRRQHNLKNGNNAHSNANNSTLWPTNPKDFAVKKTPDLAAKQAKRKRNITKADIGSPKDFKHVSHVGWNPDSGFDVDLNQLDDHLKAFFAKAGVSEKELQDRETREFIYGFINERGGLDAVKKENTETRQQMARPSAPPASPQVVPPVPPRAPLKPHVRAAPPPPPGASSNRTVGKSQGKPNLPRQNQNNNLASNAPPPPPLPSSNFSPLNHTEPPPPYFEQPPAYSEQTSASMNSTDANSALMESIRNGTTLKRVEERKIAAPVEARNDLLCEIRKGFSLKPVQEREVKPLSQLNETGPTDLAGALARALAERSKAIHSEDDDSEDEDLDNDEWDC